MTQFAKARARLYGFFCGVCMGVADMLPGISGGTVAFLLGVYDQFIQELTYLPRFRPSRQPLLLSIFLGMTLSFLVFSQILLYSMQTEPMNYALNLIFFGVLLGSLGFAIKSHMTWSWQTVACAMAGAIVSWLLSHVHVLLLGAQDSLLIFWAISGIGGFLAAAAMLLPGISGSTILLALGLYTSSMEHIAHGIQKLMHGVFPLQEIGQLLPLGIGIGLGMLWMSRSIAYVLRYIPQITFAFLIGLILGSLPHAWPYSEVMEYLNRSFPERVFLGFSLALIWTCIPMILIACIDVKSAKRYTKSI